MAVFPLHLTFQFEKSTKNKHRFEEVPEAGAPKIIGTLYVEQWALPTPPPPLTVVLDVAR